MDLLGAVKVEAPHDRPGVQVVQYLACHGVMYDNKNCVEELATLAADCQVEMHAIIGI